MLLLPHAEKEQCAAFIRDERVLVVWSDELDSIIPTCRDFEDRLIKLLWRSRPPPLSSSSTFGAPRSYPTSVNGSVSGHGSDAGALIGDTSVASSGPRDSVGATPAGSRPSTGVPRDLGSANHASEKAGDLEKGALIASRGFGYGLTEEEEEDELDEKADLADFNAGQHAQKSGGFLCFGRKKKLTEAQKRRAERIRQRRLVEERGVRMFAPVYNGIAAAMSTCQCLSSGYL